MLASRFGAGAVRDRQAEVLPQSQRRFSLVERIEVKARSAAFQQRFTETCDHVKAEIEQRRLVVLQHFELEADPPRTLGAASSSEERRGGKEGSSQCSSGGSRHHKKKN